MAARFPLGPWIGFQSLVYLLVSMITGYLANPDVRLQICQLETFKASCPENHVIRMVEARYGRMRIGKCVSQDMGHLGCQADVLTLADSKCSGRRQCEVSVPDPDMAKSRPCKELQNYLEVIYTCQQVESIEGSICRSCDFIRPKKPSGYISNAVTEETGCGSTDCPWLLAGSQGQKIRISLIDYGVPKIASQTYEPGSSDTCKVYAVLKEDSTGKSATVCGGKQKEEMVYTSQKHAVEVRILRSSNPGTSEYFLIKYEIIGCPYLAPPEGAEVHVTDKVATISCTTSNQSWKLSCDGKKWIGEYSNCTNYLATTSKQQGQGIPYGMSIAIVVGVAFVIGSIIVVAGLACYKFRRSRNRAAQRGERRVPPFREDLYPAHHPHPHLHHPQGDEIHLTYTLGIRECKEGNPNCPGTLQRQKMCCDAGRNDYAHIWESPLPPPKPL